ncbi:MAG: carbon-nitrogen hydrolase family protein [Planctomycetota bacterium]|jgi:N-carbamoylputrescine amidase
MKAALVVRRVPTDQAAGLQSLCDRTAEAAGQGADLVLFPEAAITGLVNNDDPTHDLPLGQEIPGPVTDRLAGVAAGHRIWLATGLFERASDQLYDSAVLFTPGGEIGLKYRRMHSGWHGRSADPAVYREGTELPELETPFGSIAFLICGDLFDDSIVERCRSLGPDYLLVPMVRSFDDASCDQERWDATELPVYRERVRLTGTTTLIVNSLSNPALPASESFGGAWIISGAGELMEALPLGREGVLYASV